MPQMSQYKNQTRLSDLHLNPTPDYEAAFVYGLDSEKSGKFLFIPCVLTSDVLALSKPGDDTDQDGLHVCAS